VIGCSSKFHSEDSMRAYQLPKGGAGIDALVKVERPDPKPAYRQVMVKVKACSLNFRDLGIVRGTYRMPVRENLIPLSNGAGEVIEVGPDVTRRQFQQRSPAHRDRTGWLGM
jgi:NADPH:quinone reductase-like Zn-dependent oxidoreductase